MIEKSREITNAIEGLIQAYLHHERKYNFDIDESRSRITRRKRQLFKAIENLDKKEQV